LASSEPTIIFLHIGKTGGSSLRPVLRRQFRRDEILEFRAPLPQDGRLRREGALASFAALPEAERAGARLVMGHAPFGLHEMLPRPSTYVTMLRDPVKLVVSLYHYIRRTPKHVLHDQVVGRDLSIEAFISSGLSLETDNSQVRAIAGDTAAPFGGCGPEMLASAQAHLEERFAAIGLTERFDESLLFLGRAFGWTRLQYLKANVAPASDRGAPSPEAIEMIRAQNNLDIELYGWVTERFERQIATDPAFASDLAELRRRIRRYRPWGRLTEELPRRVAAWLPR
jgi:Galactose-3-O-sulfotransferase